ncbi:MAG TPA: M20/M25/M40 family metallo-hydrolase, partial [Vicinamibacterales bacterium]|nr:M20/M25/M40 family metallo-hydrolase [Vicinamibacterales bacterium]
RDQVVAGSGLQKTGLVWSADDRSVLFIGAAPSDLTRSDVYMTRDAAEPVVITTEPGNKTTLQIDNVGQYVIYSEAAQSPFAPRGGGAGRAGGGGGGGTPPSYGLVALGANTTRKVSGTGLTMSADGSMLAWTSRNADATSLTVAPTSTLQPSVVRTGRERLEAPALSPDGKQVAFQLMTGTDWEIYVADTAPATETAARRVTRDIQHDLLPRFLTNDTLIGMMGEARHRRSQLYDLKTGSRTRLFANNTVRTISPEYVWLPSADGRRLVIQAERDGDTVSTERDVSVVDLTRKITMADLLARIDRQLADENDLRARMTKAFQPVSALTREVLARGAVNHVYEYEKAQFDFDSKHITQPGNAKAIEYLERTYRSFGYEPELQWFNPTIQQRQYKTANIVSVLKGTENPDLIYVVSSHFDSVAVGPGADDDTSGTAALLEAARMLAKTPLPATVVFASFTGEEAGLLGSREFVRVAAERKWNIVGALNNDMIGWGAESARMDNTIRYSNAGIRDVQHGAAFLFTDLILYDAKYYKSTDAAAFYDGWGDIVGGIGSYPVLANPNYHQPTDFIETMNFRQILETARVTTATIINLASSPSRLKQVTATRTASGIEVTWTPSLETGVKSYIVAYGPADAPFKTRVTATRTKTVLPALPAGSQIAVKGVNARGMEGWDWQRTTVK